MKKYILFYIILYGILLSSVTYGYSSEIPAPPPSYQDAYSSETKSRLVSEIPNEEHIQQFDVDIQLQKDSSYTITEKIIYNFGKKHDKHGIYRDIPYHYKRDSGDFSVRIDIQKVTDENGNNIPYKKSFEGNNLRIRIGDQEKTVTGILTYNITYTVQRGILFFPNHDELYWNVTGNEWPVPVKQSKVLVHFPTTIARNLIKNSCFTGSYGSIEKNCTIEIMGDAIVGTIHNPLEKKEGFTIVIGIPPDILHHPEWWQEVVWFVQDNWALMVPFLILIIMIYQWFTHGRDPETGKHIALMYGTPHNMSPGEVGVLVDEKADQKDISGMLIQLAVRGYITIKEIETKILFFKNKDYIFTKLKEPEDDLKSFEKTLLNGIFNGGTTKNLSQLKDKFYRTLGTIKSELYTCVTSDGYFPTNPEHIRNIYIGIGIFVALVGSVIGIGLENPTYIFGFLPSGILLAIFGQIMPRKTAKGMEAYIHILGLKLYLSRAEKKQIDFFNAPEKKPEIFEKFLPYAMVLGVETAWAKEFEDIYKEPPSWYETRSMHSFNSLSFIHSLNSFATTTSSTMSSSPSRAGSGGSGFRGGGSGGGFGGGGGGSW